MACAIRSSTTQADLNSITRKKGDCKGSELCPTSAFRLTLHELWTMLLCRLRAIRTYQLSAGCLRC